MKLSKLLWLCAISGIIAYFCITNFAPLDTTNKIIFVYQLVGIPFGLSLINRIFGRWKILLDGFIFIGWAIKLALALFVGMLFPIIILYYIILVIIDSGKRSV